jgi:hypothetical protein
MVGVETDEITKSATVRDQNRLKPVLINLSPNDIANLSGHQKQCPANFRPRNRLEDRNASGYPEAPAAFQLCVFRPGPQS